MEFELNRFVEAQKSSYAVALAEVKNGRKQSHWMWFIFPQVVGLGYSYTAKYYAIKNLDEAVAYLNHPALGSRPDDVKLKSCMTLFSVVPGANNVFRSVLEKFFNGKEDSRTLEIIKAQTH